MSSFPDPIHLHRSTQICASNNHWAHISLPQTYSKRTLSKKVSGCENPLVVFSRSCTGAAVCQYRELHISTEMSQSKVEHIKVKREAPDAPLQLPRDCVPVQLRFLAVVPKQFSIVRIQGEFSAFSDKNIWLQLTVLGGHEGQVVGSYGGRKWANRIPGEMGLMVGYQSHT